MLTRHQCDCTCHEGRTRRRWTSSSRRCALAWTARCTCATPAAAPWPTHFPAPSGRMPHSRRTRRTKTVLSSSPTTSTSWMKRTAPRIVISCASFLLQVFLTAPHFTHKSFISPYTSLGKNTYRDTHLSSARMRHMHS